MKKYQKEDALSYALGAFPSIELIKNRPQDVAMVYQSSQYDHTETLAKLCQTHKVPLETNDRIIEKLSDKENVFVIAVFRKSTHPLTEGNHIVLVHPENMGNFGTILRTVAGFGLSDIAVILPSVDIFDPKVIRSSMGSFFHMNIQTFASFEAYRTLFPNHRCYPMMLQSAVYLDSYRFPKAPSALIFGPEGNGLTEDFASLGQSLKIRQDARVDSFNLPIAVALTVYEFTRQTR